MSGSGAVALLKSYIVRRRHAGMLFEDLGKVIRTGIAAGAGDDFHRSLFSRQQQAFRMEDADVGQVFSRRGPCARGKYTNEMVLCYLQQVGQLVDAVQIGILRFDHGDRIPDKRRIFLFMYG